MATPRNATIGIGTTANDGTGNALRTAFQKVNGSPGALSAMPGTGWFPVTAYSTVGQDITDGVTDATVAIQATINAVSAAGGGIVFIPQGTYLVSTTLTLGDGVSIVGEGDRSLILGSSTFAGTYGIIRVSGGVNTVVRGIGIWGNAASLPVNCIQFFACTGCRAINLDVRLASHEGIALNQNCNDNLIMGCQVSEISGANGWGISAFWNCLRNRIIGNTIRDCQDYGIILDDGTSGQTDNLPCKRNVIQGNTIETTTTNMWGIGVEGSHENVVEGNVISVIGTYGIDVAMGNSTTVYAAENNIVKNNFIRATKGLRVAGSYNLISDNIIDASDSGIVLDQSITLDSASNRIEGNTIKTLTAGNKTGIQVSNLNFKNTVISRNVIVSSGKWGIYIQLGSGFTINDNIIRSTQQEGINVTASGTIDGLEIRNNRLAEVSLQTADGYAAIIVDATGQLITNARIADNLYTDTTGRANAVVRLIGGAGTFSNAQVARNRSLNSTIRQYVVFSPTTVNSDAGFVAYTGGAVVPVSTQDDETIVITATSNVTVSVPTYNLLNNSPLRFIILQDGVGGRTVTWDAGYKKSWSDTGNTLGKRSSIQFVYDTANTAWIQIGAQSPYI